MAGYRIHWSPPGWRQHPNAKEKNQSGELTKEGEQQSHGISEFRILVEHATGGANRCRTVKDRLRYQQGGFDDLVTERICGLHNYRITVKECLLINIKSIILNKTLNLFFHLYVLTYIVYTYYLSEINNMKHE